MFYKKSAILDLLNRTRDLFWKMDETRYTKKTLNRARFLTRDIFFNTAIFFIAVSVLKPLLIGRGFMTFKCYRPEWLPRFILLAVQDVMCATTTIVFVCFDIMVCTLLTLTQIQFRMLGNRLRQLYDTDYNGTYHHEVVRARLKDLVDHYNLLME